MAIQNDKYQVAVKIGRLGGRNVYRVPVEIRHNSSRACRTLKTRRYIVTAFGAADAANWARDHLAGNIPETEIIATGPKGGKAERYIGWLSAVGSEVFARGPVSGDLFAGELVHPSHDWTRGKGAVS